MKHNFKSEKRILAAAIAAIMLTMGAAFAAEEETADESTVLISETAEAETVETEEAIETEAADEDVLEPITEGEADASTDGEIIVPTHAISENPVILINGVQIEGPAGFMHDGKAFVPVRAISEALGMVVEWDAETDMVALVKLPTYITFSTKADGYTFARTAPMLLGSAPVLKDWRTFVPVNFIDEILGAEYTVTENGDIDIAYDIDMSVTVSVIETSTDDNGNTTITVQDDKMNSEVVLTIAPETVITDEEGNAVTADKIEKGAELKVLYSEAMTMSIPPITNAVTITVLNTAE